MRDWRIRHHALVPATLTLIDALTQSCPALLPALLPSGTPRERRGLCRRLTSRRTLRPALDRQSSRHGRGRQPPSCRPKPSFADNTDGYRPPTSGNRPRLPRVHRTALSSTVSTGHPTGHPSHNGSNIEWVRHGRSRRPPSRRSRPTDGPRLPTCINRPRQPLTLNSRSTATGVLPGEPPHSADNCQPRPPTRRHNDRTSWPPRSERPASLCSARRRPPTRGRQRTRPPGRDRHRTCPTPTAADR